MKIDIRRNLSVAALALGPLVLGAGPSGLKAHAQQPDGCQGAGCEAGFSATDPPIDLVAAYALCSEAAASRMLSPAEAWTCSAAFLRLKLAFLPEVMLDGFLKMNAAERSEVNRRGYLQYLRWKETVQAEGS